MFFFAFAVLAQLKSEQSRLEEKEQSLHLYIQKEEELSKGSKQLVEEKTTLETELENQKNVVNSLETEKQNLLESLEQEKQKIETTEKEKQEIIARLQEM